MIYSPIYSTINYNNNTEHGACAQNESFSTSCTSVLVQCVRVCVVFSLTISIVVVVVVAIIDDLITSESRRRSLSI